MAGILWPKGNSSAPTLAGFKVQTSVYGLPIPIVYGTARIAANLLHYVAGPVSKGDNRESKWAPSTSTNLNYSALVLLGLCEGPLTPIRGTVIQYVWSDKDTPELWAILDATGWDQAVGTHNQAAWTDLPTAERVPYQYTVYVNNPMLALPNNIIPNFSWEVFGFFGIDQSGGSNFDAYPSDILPDFLSNPSHGLGFPAAAIGDLTAYAAYCAAFDLYVSPALTDLNQARAFVDDLMLVSNSAVVWSDGLMKVIPYGDTAKGGFTPNTTPIYDFTDNDYLGGPPGDEESQDPLLVTRIDPAAAYNDVTVGFESRFDALGNVAYNTDSVDASTDSAITAALRLPAPTLSLPMIKMRDVARVVAQTQLQRYQHIRNTYVWKAGWKFSLLEPMDLVTLSDTALGLSLTPVRIIQAVELADGAGIEFTAEDWPFGSATATLYPSQNGAGFAPNLNVDPGDTEVGAILEPPSALLLSPLDIWSAVSGGDKWGGCDVWFSADNVSFSKIGTVHTKSVFGELTAALPSFFFPLPSVDTTHTLSVDITPSGGQLLSASSTEFAAYVPLIWVNGEFLLYETATLTSALHYDLTHLGRGAYGSPIAGSAAIGAPFVWLDPNADGVFRFAYPQGTLGQAVFFKFPAFNIYGNALQDLATVGSFSHTIGKATIPFLPPEPFAQGSVSIAVNGSWSFTVDGTESVKSYKWLTSTTAYPTDSDTALFGTGVNAAGPFSVAAGGVLTFGDTLFLTVLEYPLPSYAGTAVSIHLRGSYQSYTATKTVGYSRAIWTPGFFNISGAVTHPNGLQADSAGRPSNYPIDPGNAQGFAATILVSQGCEAHEVEIDGYWNSATTSLDSVTFGCELAGGTLNVGSFSPGGGSQTVTLTLADTPVVSGDTLSLVGAWGIGSGSALSADGLQAGMADFRIIYNMLNPEQTL